MRYNIFQYILDKILIWKIGRMLKKARKEESKMIDKVLKLWQ